MTPKAQAHMKLTHLIDYVELAERNMTDTLQSPVFKLFMRSIKASLHDIQDTLATPIEEQHGDTQRESI